MKVILSIEIIIFFAALIITVFTDKIPLENITGFGMVIVVTYIGSKLFDKNEQGTSTI